MALTLFIALNWVAVLRTRYLTQRISAPSSEPALSTFKLLQTLIGTGPLKCFIAGKYTSLAVQFLVCNVQVLYCVSDIDDLACLDLLFYKH